MSEYWTLVDENGMGLYLVDSEEEALKWCHADYCAVNVIRPLRVYMAHDVVAAEQAAYERVRSENRDLRDVLIRGGFVPCGVPACNCGSWHHRFGYPERFREIEELLQDNDISTNGVTLLSAIKALVEERDRLRAELASAQSRLDAVREIYAGMDGFVPQTAPEAYCLRIIREMAHAAMAQEKP